MELPVNGSPAEDESAGRRQHRTPVWTLGVVMRPHTLSSVDIPRLHFAEMIRAWNCERLTPLNAHERPARRVLLPMGRSRTGFGVGLSGSAAAESYFSITFFQRFGTPRYAAI